MRTQEEPLEEMPVEIAATRPQMVPLWILGSIPLELCALMVFVFGIWGVVSDSLGVLVIAVATWRILAWLVSYDYHAVTLALRYVGTSAWTLDDKAQGGCGPTTMPLRTRRPKGM